MNISVLYLVLAFVVGILIGYFVAVAITRPVGEISISEEHGVIVIFNSQAERDSADGRDYLTFRVRKKN